MKNQSPYPPSPPQYRLCFPFREQHPFHFASPPCCPPPQFLLIFFMDTSLFYQVATTVFGILVGMLKLDLGVLTGWEDVVTEFYRAPARYR